MSLSEVFRKNYKDLMILLPMNDDLFMAELYEHDLLPGNMKATLNSILVPTTRATHFLDNEILPSVNTGDRTRFDVLLGVMKKCNHKAVQNLGEAISSSLNEESSPDKKIGNIVHS